MDARRNDEKKRTCNEKKITKRRANSFSSRFFTILLLLTVWHPIISFPFSRSYNTCKLTNVYVNVYEHIHTHTHTQNRHFSTKLSCLMTKEHLYVPITHAYSTRDLCHWPLEHTDRWMLSNDPVWVYINAKEKKRWKRRKKKRGKNSSLLPEASRFITIIVIRNKYNKKKKEKNRSYC